MSYKFSFNFANDVNELIIFGTVWRLAPGSGNKHCRHTNILK